VAGASDSRSGAAVERKMFTLGATTFAIDLPATAAIHGPSAGESVAFDLTKGRSLQRSLIFSTGDREAKDRFTGTENLANGVRLEYEIEHNTGGGRGLDCRGCQSNDDWITRVFGDLHRPGRMGP
jgi:hypothetical protein